MSKQVREPQSDERQAQNSQQANPILRKIVKPNSEIAKKWRGADDRKKRAIMLGLIIAGVVITMLIVGGLPRIFSAIKFGAQSVAEKNDLPGVHVEPAKLAKSTEEYSLPGNVMAWEESTLFARTNGFVKKWYVDIGDRVKKGQLLADIVAPDVDQQLQQALHALSQAKATVQKDQANQDYAKTTMNRWINLRNQGAVSKQDADTNINAYKTAEKQVEADADAVRSAEANVKQLQAVTGFQKIIAPFDGIITARTINTGDLISSGSGSTTTSMYKIAAIGVVRVYVQVPQRYVDAIQTGSIAEVSVDEIGGRKFKGVIVRNSRELDPVARTLQTEIDVKNDDYSLLPGMYAQVKLYSKRAHPTVMIPSTGLVVRPDVNEVCTVDNKGGASVIHWKRVEIGRDYGEKVEILNGLQGNEQIVINPTDDDTEGRKVRIVKDKDKNKKKDATGQPDPAKASSQNGNGNDTTQNGGNSNGNTSTDSNANQGTNKNPNGNFNNSNNGANNGGMGNSGGAANGMSGSGGMNDANQGGGNNSQNGQDNGQNNSSQNGNSNNSSNQGGGTNGQNGSSNSEGSAASNQGGGGHLRPLGPQGGAKFISAPSPNSGQTSAYQGSTNVNSPTGSPLSRRQILMRNNTQIQGGPNANQSLPGITNQQQTRASSSTGVPGQNPPLMQQQQQSQQGGSPLNYPTNLPSNAHQTGSNSSQPFPEASGANGGSSTGGQSNLYSNQMTTDSSGGSTGGGNGSSGNSSQ